MNPDRAADYAQAGESEARYTSTSGNPYSSREVQRAAANWGMFMRAQWKGS